MAKQIWGKLRSITLESLADLTRTYSLQISSGDLILLDGRWYVTHSGLLRVARKNHCRGIHVQLISELSDASASRWTFKSVVFKAGTCRGFAGYGDADPTNVSPVVRGAEMRVAETRAVNRALRKAYGIGICSVEELGSSSSPDLVREPKKLPARPVNGNGWNNGSKVRDRLCQLIRQHQLDASLVKAYATEFCGVKTLREATREQVENFVQHLADWAQSDRSALLCQLNSYLGAKEGAA